MVAHFIQDAMDGPLGAKQTELASDVSRCAETLASPVLDEGHHHRFLLWCQLRLATTIAVCIRCNASVAEMCLVLLHVDAFRSKLKGSLAWPTTSWCEGKRSSRLNQKLQIKPREGTMLRMSQNFPSRPELLRARRKVWDIPTTLLCRHGSPDSVDIREWTCHITMTLPRRCVNTTMPNIDNLPRQRPCKTLEPLPEKSCTWFGELRLSHEPDTPFFNFKRRLHVRKRGFHRNRFLACGTPFNASRELKKTHAS